MSDRAANQLVLKVVVVGLMVSVTVQAIAILTSLGVDDAMAPLGPILYGALSVIGCALVAASVAIFVRLRRRHTDTPLYKRVSSSGSLG